MKIIEGGLVLLFFMGVLLAGSESAQVWPWNNLAGAAVMVLAYVGIRVQINHERESNTNPNQRHFRD